MDILILWWEAALLVQSFSDNWTRFVVHCYSVGLTYYLLHIQHQKKKNLFFFFRNSCWIMYRSRCWEWCGEFDSLAPTSRGFDRHLFWCKMNSFFHRGLYTNISLSYNRAGEGMWQHCRSSVNRQQSLWVIIFCNS